MTGNAEVTGTLLAGGLSRRMGGGDKALKPIEGRPMLAYVIARMAPQVCRLVINANGDPARFSAFGLPIVADPLEGHVGPLAGVLAGLQWTARVEPRARWTVTTPSDAPFLPRNLVARLLAAAEGDEQTIVLAQSGGRLHPVVGLWPVALAADLEAALRDGVRKVLDWTERHKTRTAQFAPEVIGGEEVDPFFNANRPDELAEACRLMALSASSA